MELSIKHNMFYSCRSFLFVLLLTFALAAAEIHRARGIKPPKSRNGGINHSPRSTWPPGPNIETNPPAPADSVRSWNDENIYDNSVYKNQNDEKESHSKEAWIYSIISACLVGLSGIFPLLVIPLESGESLKHGVAAAKLKLLLSFAVGGLLGDVFLHLLPEAWAHLKGYESHKNAGIWVILGLCSFLVIEKLFPESEEEEDEAENEDLPTTEGTTTLEDKIDNSSNIATETTKSVYSLRPRKNNKHSEIHNCIEQNGHSPVYSHKATNGDIKTNGVIAYSAVCNGTAEKNSPIASSIKSHKASNREKPHIKTSGWLNLVANVIDNFTHGLAVAGSYCVSTKVGLLTTFAILLHEIPHEVGDFAILLKSGFDRWKAAKAQILTASGGIFGALCALMADSVQEAGKRTAWVLPFTAGGFIYIAMVTVVPDLMKEKNNRESMKQMFFLGSGIAVMALVTVLSE